MKKELRELRAFKKKYGIKITVDKNMPDYSNEPFFIAKNEKAAEFLKKHPIERSEQIEQPVKHKA